MLPLMLLVFAVHCEKYECDVCFITQFNGIATATIFIKQGQQNLLQRKNNMSKNNTVSTLSVAVLVALAANAHGSVKNHNNVLENHVNDPAVSHLHAPSISQVINQSQTKTIQQTNTALAKQRARYMSAFNKAYNTYPSIPAGFLESLAYVASRWEHRPPSAHDGHHGMPQTIGLFGLYETNNGGFSNTLDNVANAYGVDKQRMIDDLDTYVMATAAFIEREIIDLGIQGETIEQHRPIFALLSGIPAENRINEYAVNSFVFDALNILERGYDDNGIRINSREIHWNDAFNADEMRYLRAKGLVINAETGEISLKGEQVQEAESNRQGVIANPDGSGDTEINDEVKSDGTNSGFSLQSTDYPPALWVTSPNYSSRNDTISHVAIHTMQGSYSGSISWFQNPNSSASAHYMVRSSDGQVTQMVREYQKAWHARSANPYSVGIEHEGYVSNPAWYTEAMYSASANITKHICAKYSVNCANAYSGSAHSTVTPLSQSYTVKGHQHFPSQTHTDPGINWNWSKYASMVGGSSGGGGNPTTTIIDNFETSEGRFYNTPAYSGSTTGISTSSTAVRSTSQRKNGSASEQIKLVDNSSTSASWSVRFLSGGGSPSNNVQMTVNNGKVGFWILSGGSGVTTAIAVDDGSGTEKSISRSVPQGVWTFVEWELDNSSHWNAWFGSSNGRIDASSVTIDAIWFHRAQTSYNVYINIDDVQHSVN